MAKVGDWLRIDCMQGEPQYTGKIGQIDHIDSKGYLHGTWGGCSILPEDNYTLLSEEEAKKLIEEERQKKIAAIPPKWELPQEEFSIIADMTAVPSRLQRLNGIMPYKIRVKVVFKPNGSFNSSHKYERTIHHVNGIAESHYEYIRSLLNNKLKQNCCYSIEFEPCDVRKDIAQITKAVEELLKTYPVLAK